MSLVCRARTLGLAARPTFPPLPLGEGRGEGLRPASLAAIALLLLLASAAPAAAQNLFGISNRFELADAIQLEAADPTTRTHLERAREFLVNEQWEEAIDTLLTVLEGDADKLIEVTSRRYLSVRDFCHLQIADLPPPALALYRARIDPTARQWFEQATATRSSQLLQTIVRQAFCSSWGDDALLALGDLSLEKGDLGGARGYWERILPAAYWAELAPPSSQAEGTATWLIYPDTDIPLADVRARLVLVPILEGKPDQARLELAAMAEDHSQAGGKLGGKQVNYLDYLGNLARQAESWPATAAKNAGPAPDWTTFAGTPQRNGRFPDLQDVGAPRWRQPLPKAPQADFGYHPRRVGEDRQDLLSYHPLVVDGLVLVNSLHEIRAWRLATGESAWGNDPVIYKDEPPAAETRRAHPSLGAARFTMTAHAGRLYARMGNPVTSALRDDRGGATLPGYLVCLDLQAEGRLAWRADPQDAGWAFEGTPVADAGAVYVVMRRSDVPPLVRVVCLDAASGKTRWKRFVCGAETPAQGQADEITHGLLTLHEDGLYLNTNLGAVAALDKRDGGIQWLTRYPRAKAGDFNQRAKHFYRDLTPCLYDAGTLYAAPADSRHILALDAATGLLLWETNLPEDAIHLLGIGGGNLLASGDKLWWIDAKSGKLASVGWQDGAWPDGPSPKGFGRGMLAGDRVYWPTRDRIHVFDQATGRKEREIELSSRDAAGGNLLMAGDSLLIAGSQEIVLLSPHSGMLK